MLFQHIFNAISLLTNHHKKRLYQLSKKIGCLSLTAFFASSMSAIKAEDINTPPSLLCPPGTGDPCPEPMAETFFARDSNFATAPASRTFDYDPGLLPEVAETIFVLRIKHTNIDKPFVINLSGNYLLRFDKNKIDILDTYTKNTIVYRDQTANPNITIGLGVSKGLPRNYKSITIKEDAHGKLYDYAALRSDNISTDESMLTETLSHPFYQITGEDGVENEVKVTKAMAFYRTVLSHERHARCVKSSTSIFSQLQDILWGSGVCGPKAGRDIFTANHQPAAEMKLDQQLVEAAYQNNLKYGVGYQFKRSWDVDKQNAVAVKASSLFCGMGFINTIGEHRRKRDLTDQEFPAMCLMWATAISSVYMVLYCNFNQLEKIILVLVANAAVAAEKYFLKVVLPDIYNDNIKLLKQYINRHGASAKLTLQLAAGVMGQAVMTNPEFLANYRGIADVQDAVARGTPALYEVSKEAFKPLPNEVSRVDSSGKVKVVNGERYTTHTVSSAHFDEAAKEKINTYLQTLNEWKTQFKAMLRNTDADAETETETKAKIQLYFIINLTEGIGFYLSKIRKRDHPYGIELLNTIYHNDVLIGISVGLLQERDYQTVVQLSSPQALTNKEGGYRGVLPYLESEVVKDLFSRDLIDKASIVKIVPQGTAFPAEIELHDEL